MFIWLGMCVVSVCCVLYTCLCVFVSVGCKCGFQFVSTSICCKVWTHCDSVHFQFVNMYMYLYVVRLEHIGTC